MIKPIAEIHHINIYAIILLYENHLGLNEDVMGSFSSILHFEAEQNEKDASLVQNQRESLAQARIDKYGTKEEREEEHKEYQVFIDNLYSSNPKRKITDIYEAAADHFSVSTKTITRYCNNPKKQRKN